MTVVRSAITAAEAFNEKGVDGVGIAAIMKRAGLTIGAFSRHFDSKEQLVREVIVDSISRSSIDPETPLESVIRFYLGTEHRDQN